MSSLLIDLRAMDTHQHDDRILKDGSIKVDPSDLAGLRMRLWLQANISTEQLNARDADRRRG